MLLDRVRKMPGIHHRKPAMVPSSLRTVKLPLSRSLIAEVLPGRRPDLADDREMDLDDRAGRSHLFDFGSGIAEKRLTGEIYAQRHAGPCSSSGSYSGTVGNLRPPRGACR